MGKKEVVWYHWNYHYAQMKAYDGIAKSSIN
jgi:hypothetical protein